MIIEVKIVPLGLVLISVLRMENVTLCLLSVFVNKVGVDWIVLRKTVESYVLSLAIALKASVSVRMAILVMNVTLRLVPMLAIIMAFVIKENVSVIKITLAKIVDFVSV
jgi:hypothetical protein